MVKNNTSNSNEVWMYIGLTILIIASLLSILIGYFLVSHIDLITELYQS